MLINTVTDLQEAGISAERTAFLTNLLNDYITFDDAPYPEGYDRTLVAGDEAYVVPVIRLEWNAGAAAAWGFTSREQIEEALAQRSTLGTFGAIQGNCLYPSKLVPEDIPPSADPSPQGWMTQSVPALLVAAVIGLCGLFLQVTKIETGLLTVLDDVRELKIDSKERLTDIERRVRSLEMQRLR